MGIHFNCQLPSKQVRAQKPHTLRMTDLNEWVIYRRDAQRGVATICPVAGRWLMKEGHELHQRHVLPEDGNCHFPFKMPVFQVIRYYDQLCQKHCGSCTQEKKKKKKKMPKNYATKYNTCTQMHTIPRTDM